MLAEDQVERVLVVTAHPDDVDFGAGGTVARWTDAGVAVTYVVATDGDAGGFDPAVPRSDIAGIRQAEQSAAAAALGVQDVVFLGFRDGALTPGLDLRREISRHIRRVRPQRVVCHSPERNWLRVAANHPDHRAAGSATLDAVYPDARNPFAFPELAAEGLEAWTVPEVWVMSGPAGDDIRFVDVTATFDRKVQALRAHASQTAHLPDLEAFVRGWLSTNAAEAGYPSGRLAERFAVLATA